jgi:hypothetical protein
MNQSALGGSKQTREATNEWERATREAISRAIASELQGMGKATARLLLYDFQPGVGAGPPLRPPSRAVIARQK